MDIKKEAPTRKRLQTISRRVPWSFSVMYVPIMMMDIPMIYSPYPNDLTTMYTYHLNARHAQLNELFFLKRRSKQLWIIKTETPWYIVLNCCIYHWNHILKWNGEHEYSETSILYREKTFWWTPHNDTPQVKDEIHIELSKFSQILSGTTNKHTLDNTLPNYYSSWSPNLGLTIHIFLSKRKISFQSHETHIILLHAEKLEKTKLYNIWPVTRRVPHE